LAMLSTPLIATALLVGCQQAPSGTELTEPATNPQGDEVSSASNDEVTPVSYEKGQLGDLAEACGFKCKVLADGSANISGVRGIDAFFGATLTLRDKALLLEGEVSGTLG